MICAVGDLVLLDEGNCVDNNKEIVVYLRRNWRTYEESDEKQARHFVSDNYVLDCVIKGLNRRESIILPSNP